MWTVSRKRAQTAPGLWWAKGLASKQLRAEASTLTQGARANSATAKQADVEVIVDKVSTKAVAKSTVIRHTGSARLRWEKQGAKWRTCWVRGLPS